MIDCDYCPKPAKHFLVQASDAAAWPERMIGAWFWIEKRAMPSLNEKPELQACGVHRRTADKDLGGLGIASGERAA